MKFLMVDGRGDPNNSPLFQEAVEALYGVAYTVKFALKKEGIGPEYTVPPLEGLWWMEGQTNFDLEDKANWCWTLIIMQPEHVKSAHVRVAVEELRAKKNPPGLDRLTFEVYDEGKAVQILHVGPYSDERTTIEKLHAFAQEQGYRLHKKHHEIYLSDPRRTKPERLRTVLRQPVIKVD
jgi:hypothetical protein